MKNLILGIVTFFGLYVSTTLACSCVGFNDNLTPAERIRRQVDGAAIVFLGNLAQFDFIRGVPKPHVESRLAKDPNFTWETKTVVFDVERWWKGPEESKVSIVTDETRNSDGTRSGSSCDVEFELKKTYLIFAYKNGDFFRINICSIPPIKGEQIDHYLPYLGEGTKPKSVSN